MQTSGNLQCYACGHRYFHAGMGPHPGVCPECQDRAVTFAGEVEISAIEKNRIGLFASDDSPVLTEIYFQDATDRRIIYTLSETSVGYEVSVVRIADTRVTPNSPHWDESLLPQGLAETVADHDAVAAPVALRGYGAP